MSSEVSKTAFPTDNSRRLAMCGGELNQEDEVLLDERIAKNPGDVDSRIKLLGYYFCKRRENADAESNRERHIVWLIENCPELQVLGSPYGQLNMHLEPQSYERAAQAWKKVITESPENLLAFKNAAAYFELFDRNLSEELLLKGQQLDAESSKWAAALGELYYRDSIFMPQGVSRRETAKKAFDQYLLAYNLSESAEKETLLISLAKSALAAGLNDDAQKFATMMLADNTPGWNKGNRIHHGNLVLGQIALADGAVDRAKSLLIRAGQTCGSPQLNSFGPSMELAKCFLECGECEIVLEYFEMCKKFWKSDRQRLNLWSDEVKANRIPDFGSNSVY